MKLKLNNVRISFPDLWTAKSVNDGKPRFGCNLLVEPDSKEHKAILKAMKDIAKEKWGAKADRVYTQLEAQDRLCLHDGSLKDYEGYEGMWFVSANSYTRPTVIDRDRTPLVEQDGRPYSGCYVNAIVDIYPQDKPGEQGKRINCGLGGIQFFKDGEAFSGGQPAAPDDFDAFDDEDDDDLA